MKSLANALRRSLFYFTSEIKYLEDSTPTHCGYIDEEVQVLEEEQCSPYAIDDNECPRFTSFNVTWDLIIEVRFVTIVAPRQGPQKTPAYEPTSPTDSGIDLYIDVTSVT